MSDPSYAGGSGGGQDGAAKQWDTLKENAEKVGGIINGVTLILSHVNEQPMRAMEKAGFVDLVGRENFCRNIEEALDHADKVLEK